MSAFILASGSRIRQSILSSAGVQFEARSSEVDEALLKDDNRDLTPSDMAVFLAHAKARDVSDRYPDHWVLGADQTMELDGRLLDKLPHRDLARDRLTAMRGKMHCLNSGLALYRDGHTVWEHQQISRLYVRAFSDDFLDRYLDQAGDELTASVGAYAYEGMGAQLFERVEADYYAVLGLPLLPLLEELRRLGVVLT